VLECYICSEFLMITIIQAVCEKKLTHQKKKVRR
jgi:hypothetical protein